MRVLIASISSRLPSLKAYYWFSMSSISL